MRRRQVFATDEGQKDGYQIDAGEQHRGKAQGTEKAAVRKSSEDRQVKPAE